MLTRQQIYDRIRTTSKDSYILDEMKRLGFWESSEVPSVPEEMIRREAEINQELNKLLEQDRKFRNREAMLREMHKERMKKAREKREQTKQQNLQKRLDKAARWKDLQLRQIIYLGKGVSAGLDNTEINTDKLQQYKLPVFHSLTELAGSMGVSLADLRYLLFQRKVSKRTHYHSFEIPKKSGGKRKISAPKTKMKALQNWVLHTILNNIPVGNHAHGFVKERSVLTNAAPHVGKDIVINIDLKDFFPSIDYKRVKGLFHSLGYSEQMSVIFALICTQADTEVVEMDGVTYYVQSGKRFLPQGSPASPAISNLITYKLDRKIQGLSRKLDFTYTRYADDLSFSTSIANEDNVSRLLCFLRKIILSEGLTIHPDKTHIMRKGGQQKVTGIVVNEKLNVERNQLRKFRALLHNIEQNGWKGQQWGQTDNLINSIEGYISFIRMVNRERAEKFRIQLGKVVEKHGYPQGEGKTCVPATPKATTEKTEATPTFEAQQKISPDTLLDETEKKKDEDKNSEWWNIL